MCWQAIAVSQTPASGRNESYDDDGGDDDNDDDDNDDDNDDCCLHQNINTLSDVYECLILLLFYLYILLSFYCTGADGIYTTDIEASLATIIKLIIYTSC